MFVSAVAFVSFVSGVVFAGPAPQADGVLFDAKGADTVIIAITGIHGNFYSNPFYYNFGDTLNAGGFDFIYAQTNDAFGQIRTVNIKTGREEIIGSWNERFSYTDEDIEAYLRFAESAGYRHIYLAGHSLGANKVIYYLSRHHDKRVEKFILLSPANLTYMMSGVTEQEKRWIQTQVRQGKGGEMLPFPFMGWIENIKTLFVNAAVRAQAAGYDGVQIHAAHGFFLSRFISPAYNHRSDAYGKTVEKRGAILLDILRDIREKSPGSHISMKINSDDFIPGGLTSRDSMTICEACADAGLDSIEISGNGTSVAGIRPGVNEAYFGEFAAKLAENISIPVILVGGHRSVENMERILNKTNIACLSLSRPFIREPDLPNRWASGDTRPSECVSCNMCYRTPGHQCVFHIARSCV